MRHMPLVFHLHLQQINKSCKSLIKISGDCELRGNDFTFIYMRFYKACCYFAAHITRFITLEELQTFFSPARDTFHIASAMSIPPRGCCDVVTHLQISHRTPLISQRKLLRSCLCRPQTHNLAILK